MVETDVDLVPRLRVVIARLARQLRQQSGTGLSPTQQSALVTIEQRGPISLGDLAAAEQVAPPTITRVVARLADEGLVTRDVDAADRRVARLSITAAGRRRLEQSRSRRAAWLATRLREDLDGDDVEVLGRALPILERLAEPGATR